jgi:hypothetical protein
VIALGDTLPIALAAPRGGIDRIGHALRERFPTVGQDRRQPEDARAKIQDLLGHCARLDL